MSNNDTNILSILRTRRSNRLYDPARAVDPATLDALLEAARWAPSGGNSQPWRYVIAQRGTPAHAQLLALLMPFNAGWAGAAPMLILSAAQLTFVGKDGKTEQNHSALHDTGMANMSLTLEAVNRGMRTRMMGGFFKDAARPLLHAVDAGLEPVCMMAVGYPLTSEAMTDEQRAGETAPRERKPVSDLLVTLS